MTGGSIDAYDLPERVARYDADMAVMHPNRAKMVEVALAVLPFGREEPLSALDIGAGTAYFTARFLGAFPRARVHALDGAEAMIELAAERLGPRRESVTFSVGDFRDLGRILAGERFDVVFSSYALHHLTRDEKTSVVGDAVSLLQPGGWLLNADIIVAESKRIEERVQDIRVRGILQRAAAGDPRFAGYDATRRYLDEMEAAEGDRPITLAEDLLVLREAGLEDVEVFWLEYREAVTGGREP